MLLPEFFYYLGWINDLINEGIEPNPGPAMDNVFIAVANKADPDYTEALLADLRKIGMQIRNCCKPGESKACIDLQLVYC